MVAELGQSVHRTCEADFEMPSVYYEPVIFRLYCEVITPSDFPRIATFIQQNMSARRKKSEAAVTEVSEIEVQPFPAIDLPIQPPFPPMEAKLVPGLPEGVEWLYEPKWDGFRGLAFRKGNEILLQSKAGQTLARYFPELIEELQKLPQAGIRA